MENINHLLVLTRKYHSGYIVKSLLCKNKLRKLTLFGIFFLPLIFLAFNIIYDWLGDSIFLLIAIWALFVPTIIATTFWLKKDYKYLYEKYPFIIPHLTRDYLAIRAKFITEDLKSSDKLSDEFLSKAEKECDHVISLLSLDPRSITTQLTSWLVLTITFLISLFCLALRDSSLQIILCVISVVLFISIMFYLIFDFFFPFTGKSEYLRVKKIIKIIRLINFD